MSEFALDSLPLTTTPIRGSGSSGAALASGGMTPPPAASPSSAISSSAISPEPQPIAVLGRRFIVSRTRPSFLSAPVYSIQMEVDLDDKSGLDAAPEGSDSPSASSDTIFAQLWSGSRKTQYVISRDVQDLSKKRQERGSRFVGKLKVEHAERVYLGYLQRSDHDLKTHVLSVFYDHERMMPTDHKMEVYLALQKSPDLVDVVAEIRCDGKQNLSHTNQILALVQEDDSKKMKKIDSLITLGGTANMPSTKNFSLVKMTPIRGVHFASKAPAAEQSTSNTSTAIAVTELGPSEGATANVESPSNAEDADAGTGTPEGASTSDPFMHFGRLSKNTFCCRFKEPITMVTAFMIALSRFDTTQKYS